MKEPSVSIYIDGNALPTFKQFSLNQSMYNHHAFELVMGHGVIEELGSHVLDKSKSWIGKTFHAEFGENEFIGIITSVDMSHFHGMHGDLIVQGYSPTILLEAGPHKRSWLKRPLKDIVSDTVTDAGLNVSPNPDHTAVVDYMVQYRESHFNFLKRLAATYHEWFFYDGTKIQFGKPSNLPSIPLIYGTDLDNIQISMKMAPVNFQSFSYHSTNDETYSGASPGSISGLDDMGSEAMAAGSQVYQIKAKLPTAPRIKDKNRLEEVLKKQQAAAAAGLSRIMGKSTKQELRPGMIADLKAAVRENGAWSSKTYGEYLIVGVQHHMTGNYEYTNSFEAIPAGVEVLPEPQFQMPVAEPQIARVTSNTDPKNMGRVEVQFHWQEANEKSPFLRVMTPDAGSSNAVSKNRGLLFIPEVDDYVMVGFRYNDPMRPFVMGSVYNGVTGGGGEANNKIKSISTRSGNTITLDDDCGSVYIADAKDCSINMDGDGKIKIQSGTEIKIECGSSSILMKEDGTIKIIGVNVDVLGSEKLQAASGTAPEGGNVDGSTLRLDPETATLDGKAETVVKGGDSAGMEAASSQVICDGNVSVSGEKINLN